MAVISRYSAVNAKINAMFGRLLTAGDYDNLASLKSVAEVEAALEARAEYRELLRPGPEVHRGDLERRIVLSVYHNFARIYSFVGDQRLRRYLDGFFLKNEIRFIKGLLRSINDERDINYTAAEINAAIGMRPRLDLSATLAAKTLTEAIDSLKGTVFYSLLKTGAEESDISLFELETRLDIYYFIRLNKLRNKYLSGLDKKLAGEVNGIRVDMTNLMWIYRLKKYYNIEEKAMYAYLIPLRHRLGKEQIARMVESHDMAGLMEEIGKTAYGKYFGAGRSHERDMSAVLSGAYRRVRRANADSVAGIIAYIHFKDIEIENIISLIEGVRYGLGRDEILRFVVLPSEEKAV